MVDGEEEWEVECILRECVKGCQRQALVKWKGYFTPMWESVAALVDTEVYFIFKAGG